MTGYNLNIEVNGTAHTLQITPGETLLSVLRERLGLTGTKKGCGTGECGACIVLVDGKPVNSCMVLALEADGKKIMTVEGLRAEEGPLHVLQQKFLDYGAVQCGFCTSGMLMSAKYLLDHTPEPTREQIRRALVGNICRCTGYSKIIDAIEAAARDISKVVRETEGNIGADTPRDDVTAHVQGKSRYIDDIKIPDMAVGKILRSRHAHAVILSIDTSKAEKLPGVFAVATGKDVPEGYFGVDLKDQLVFARDKVRYTGDAVAAVAAVDEETADRALSLINVQYRVLPAVFDAEKSAAPDAPVIHEKLKEYELGFDTDRYGNVCTVAEVSVGDTEKGFAEADEIVEEVYTTVHQHQCSLETHGAIAEFDSHGRVHVWSSTQKPFAMRRYMAQSLKMSMNDINVKASSVGGGFGGKLELNVEPYAVVLARKAGRAVKIVYSREEEFSSTGGRHASKYYIKSGVKRDGTVTARTIRFYYDTGAYSGNGPTTTTLVCNVACGLYRVPNLKIDGFCVYTNKPNFGSFRGPSAPQTTFALESHMDSLAAAIGMDPLDFRLKNLLAEGERTGLGQVLADVDYHAVVRAAAEKAGWKELKKQAKALSTDTIKYGVGMGCVFWLSGGWATSGLVKVNEDGTIQFVTGATEMGTGYLYTAVPQFVAEVFGIDAEEVRVVVGDTDTAGYDHGIGGSRGTFAVGMAAKMAAENARDRLFRAAAERHFKVRPDCLEIGRGRIWVKGNRNQSITVKELAYEEHMLYGGPVIGSSSYLPQMDDIDYSRIKGLSFPAFKGNTIGCHIVMAALDTETGNLSLKKYLVSQDVGKAINPQAIEGQIEGGVALGYGFAAMEEMKFDESGFMRNTDFVDYKLPTTLDLPEIESVICEIPSHYGPHGAKGLGEATMAPVAAAVGNALYDACGMRIHQTPMTAELLLKELKGLPGH